MTEQVVLITWSPGMNCVAQSTQYAISSGGQNVASSETKAASPRLCRHLLMFFLLS